jgi:hypothetical protein
MLRKAPKLPCAYNPDQFYLLLLSADPSLNLILMSTIGTGSAIEKGLVVPVLG